MSEKDLKPLKRREDCTPEELVRQEKIWKSLKGTSSAKRKIAQKISGLKRANPENVEKKLLDLISNPDISALEIMKMIEFIKTKEDMRTETFIQLINSTIKAHSTIFGNKNFNVNVEVGPMDASRVREVWLKVQEKRKNEKKEKNETDKQRAHR